ncbi:hypothetical protein BDZ89DRAFT_1130368 [Hymenopellis radicata]|nr:hypothetical protein BDZ89DRAFT_1130368 [Hymenopellis radicata]
MSPIRISLHKVSSVTARAFADDPDLNTVRSGYSASFLFVLLACRVVRLPPVLSLVHKTRTGGGNIPVIWSVLRSRFNDYTVSFATAPYRERRDLHFGGHTKWDIRRCTFSSIPAYQLGLICSYSGEYPVKIGQSVVSCSMLDAADVYDAPHIACETYLVSDECTDTPSSLSGCPPTSTSA